MSTIAFGSTRFEFLPTSQDRNRSSRSHRDTKPAATYASDVVACARRSRRACRGTSVSLEEAFTVTYQQVVGHLRSDCNVTMRRMRPRLSEESLVLFRLVDQGSHDLSDNSAHRSGWQQQLSASFAANQACFVGPARGRGRTRTVQRCKAFPRRLARMELARDKNCVTGPVFKLPMCRNCWSTARKSLCSRVEWPSAFTCRARRWIF